MSEFCIKYSEISKSVIVKYFQEFNNRENFITVIEDNGNVMGYLTLKNASSYLSECTLYLSKTRPIKHRNNFHSYQIALNVLPAYVDEFKTYLINHGVQTIGIDANTSDFNYIKSYIPEFNVCRCEDNPNKIFDVIIILRCPPALQLCLFGTAKRISFSDLLESFVLADLLKFTSDNNLQTLFIEGPITEKIQNKEKYKYLGSQLSLEEILEDKEYLSHFCMGDRNQIDYIYNSQYGVFSGNRVITNGISLRSGNFKSSKLNVNQYGERKSLSNMKDLSNPNIFIYGSCLSFGIFAEDEKTFPSYLQRLINESDTVFGSVHNMGVKGKALLINDMLLAMQSEVKSKDILVFVSPISSYSIRVLKKHNIEYFDFTKHLNKVNNPECVYLNNAYHSNVAVYKELAKFSFALISKFSVFSEQLNPSLLVSGFTYNGKKELFDQHYIWKHVFLKKYISFLNSLPRPAKGAIVGSVLITANPFTLGHASLIKRSLNYCDYLYVFVVESDSFQYTYSQRMEMVKGYLSHNPKCCVAPSGDIWGSEDLFPEYFNRNYNNNSVTISQEDAYIFCNYIAPTLGITLRFLGDENHDLVTKQYNQYLERYLPTYGIKVIRFEREKTSFGVDIEGKTIRKIIAEKGIEDESLHLYLPLTTIDAIKTFQICADM